MTLDEYVFEENTVRDGDGSEVCLLGEGGMLFRGDNATFFFFFFELILPLILPTRGESATLGDRGSFLGDNATLGDSGILLLLLLFRGDGEEV